MVSAVLFDMDGTLLEIDIEDFLRSYFSLLGPVIAGISGGAPATGLEAVIAGTEAMGASHPGQTNREVFNARFLEITGTDLSEPSANEAIERFYADVFPALRSGHGPREGAGEAVAEAKRLGLRTAVATNPIFPRSAIVERLSWAGFTPDDFDTVTSYENTCATKPAPEYFRQVAELLEVTPHDCLMVGDDPLLDLAAADVGMRTFYVGPSAVTSAHWSGTLTELALLLPRLVAAG